MNEVLAILVYAYFQEVEEPSLIFHTSCKEDLHQLAQTQEGIISFIFDAGHTFADIYWSFDRVM